MNIMAVVLIQASVFVGLRYESTIFSISADPQLKLQYQLESCLNSDRSGEVMQIRNKTVFISRLAHKTIRL